MRETLSTKPRHLSLEPGINKCDLVILSVIAYLSFLVLAITGTPYSVISHCNIISQIQFAISGLCFNGVYNYDFFS